MNSVYKMDIIENLRREVIDSNNTAQDELEGILSRLNTTTRELIFSSPMHGDLDFSVLETRGFRNIESISLEKGEVTSITNLPKSLRMLNCSNQMLNGLFDLPIFLEELICDYNYLTSFSCKDLKKLQKLHISHNRLENLDELPVNLEELYCTNNKLRLLNLEGLTELKVLHVSENPSLVIEHFSGEIIDFQSDNSPFANVQYDPEGSSGKSNDIDKMNHSHEKIKIEFLDALNIYFKLKNTYEEGIAKKKHDVFYSAQTRKLGKRRAVAVKPKCINCKRPVGTIFEIKDDKYTAICGDTNLSSKCDLNIKLFRGHFYDDITTLYMYKEEIDKTKEKIVRQKLNTLFNYIEEKYATEQFKKELETYNYDIKLYREILDLYNEKYFSKIKQEQINEKMIKLSELNAQYNEMLANYHKNPENHQLLRDAMFLHVKEIVPEIENIRRLKHEFSEMDVEINVSGANVYDITSTLVQRKVGLAKYDYNLDEPSKVLKFSKKN